MFDWLSKRKAKHSGAPVAQQKPRGILTTVEGGHVILRKAAIQVKNTYEVRLALFMAVQHEQLPFVLAVPPGAAVAPDLQAKIKEFGGTIVEESSKEFTVCIWGGVT